MSDVRLTATNPEDSSVVPVACNSSGELLLEEIPDQSFDGDLDGNLNVTGSGTFAGAVVGKGVGPAYAFEITDGTTNMGGLYRDANGANLYLKSKSGIEGARIKSDGSAVFGSTVSSQSIIESTRFGESVQLGGGSEGALVVGGSGADNTVLIGYNGSAEFKSEVTVGSRGKQWTLTEQNGLCHMVEVTRAATADLVEPDEPKLRDVLHELDLLEQALEQVMTKLRLDPPAGWPVEGSD